MGDAAAFQRFEHQVEAWVAEIAGVRRERVTPATTVNAQLGLDGAEAERLLMTLASRCGADFAEFARARYFVTEADRTGLAAWAGKLLGRAQRQGDPLPVKVLAEFMWAHGGRLPGQV